MGRAWLTHHHHHFNAIAAHDNKLQVRNLVMLFFAVFLPVPTAGLMCPWVDGPPYRLVLRAADRSVPGGALD